MQEEGEVFIFINSNDYRPLLLSVIAMDSYMTKTLIFSSSTTSLAPSAIVHYVCLSA